MTRQSPWKTHDIRQSCYGLLADRNDWLKGQSFLLTHDQVPTWANDQIVSGRTVQPAACRSHIIGVKVQKWQQPVPVFNWRHTYHLGTLHMSMASSMLWHGLACSHGAVGALMLHGAQTCGFRIPCLPAQFCFFTAKSPNAIQRHPSG